MDLTVKATWNGVQKEEIAATLKALAEYLLSKNCGSSINETMQSWLADGGVVQRILFANNEKMDEFFNTSRPQGYYPGKLTPTLIEMKELIEFLAYREELEGGAEMQFILAALNAFKAFEGSCHCAGTGHTSDSFDFISSAQRYPSEVYVYAPCGEDLSDEINVTMGMFFNWSQMNWYPEGNGDVVFRMCLGGNRDKVSRLRYHHDMFIAMVKHAGIHEGATISSDFGETYGKDYIEVRLSLEAYHNGFLRGMWEESETYNQAVKLGYIFGKNAFIYRGDLYLPSDYSSEKLEWLKRTGFVAIEQVTVPTFDVPFQKLVLQETGFQEIRIVDGEEFKGYELHNQMYKLRNEIVLDMIEQQQ